MDEPPEAAATQNPSAATRDEAVRDREDAADARDRAADEREDAADRREAEADQRERRADAREARADTREASLDDLARASGLSPIGRFRRSYEALDRADAAVTRARDHVERLREALLTARRRSGREQDEIERETRTTARAIDARADEPG
jgi:hypothetical protein